MQNEGGGVMLHSSFLILHSAFNVLPDVAVVVPCYNAGSRLVTVVERALAWAGRVWVVDDGSTDGAPWRAALEALPGRSGLKPDPLQVIAFPKNRGKGAAILAGFRAALGIPGITCIIVLDADGQHDPDEIPALYEAFTREEADLVIGARMFDRARVPWRSWFGNTVTSMVTAWLFGRRLPDTQSGFRLHSRRFAEDVVRTIPEGRYETEMAIVAKAIREGYTVASVPIRTIYEPGNPSSHFRKVRDSFRVYRTLFCAVLKGTRFKTDT
jgi:glycosyltransferase involved in cell wall biosynthesis